MIFTSYIRKRIDRIAAGEGVGPIREFLSEIVAAVFCIIGLAAVILGGVEVHLQDKSEITFVYLAAYIPVLVCFFFREKIPYSYRITILLLALYSLAILVLAGVGLSGAGIVLLITFCVLAASFLGGPKGFIAIFMSLAAIVCTGWSMSSGTLSIEVNTMTNSTRVEAWTVAAMLFFMLASVMVLCISLLQTSLQKMIFNLQDNKKKLQQSNREMQKAVGKYQKTEKKLKLSEEFHKRLFEDSPTALYIQDFSQVETRVNQLRSKGYMDVGEYLSTNKKEVSGLLKSVQISRVNHAAVELHKAGSPNELLAALDSLIKDDDSQHFIDQVVCFTSGKDLFECEARNLDFQGKTLHTLIRKIVLNRKEYGLSQILVSIVDVTALYRTSKEKQQLELELQQTRKMETIGTLAGGIAHDFNNILFPISGYTEILLEDIPKDSPYRKSLKEIYSGTMRARELVRQILTFSRQEPGQLEVFKIQTIVKEVLKLIRPSIPASIEIKKNIDSECGPVKADPIQVHQIIMNLCTNAYHAMKNQDGILTVTLSRVNPGETGIKGLPTRDAGYVCLSVSDTGTGIKKEIVDKVFDPFFTTKPQGQGTGMGLAVIHGIVSKMGGLIRVESVEEQGSTFRVYLPMVNEDVEEKSINDLDMHGGNEHILLVDDEQSVVTMQRKMLERLGYKVSSFAGSFEALRAFESSPREYDLVISDVAMPNMGGGNLASELMNIRPDVPVLLCTGFSETLTPEKAEAIGIKKVLHKPVSMRTLASSIREVLD